MNRQKKLIKARDSTGKLYVILQIDGSDSPVSGMDASPRFELPNRSGVRQITDSEFQVIETGEILTVA
jgi:hypothetical protein